MTHESLHALAEAANSISDVILNIVAFKDISQQGKDVVYIFNSFDCWSGDESSSVYDHGDLK